MGLGGAEIPRSRVRIPAAALKIKSYCYGLTHMVNYKKYKEALERMGLKQLDVYRYKDKDVVRAIRTQDSKVFLIELPKHREEMSMEEFASFIKTKIK